MKQQRVEIFLTLAAILIFLLGGLLAWLVLPWLTREQFIIAAVLVIAGLVGLGFVLSSFVTAYIAGAKQLAEEIRMIMTANPNHRIPAEDAGNMADLARTVNDFADRFQAVLNNQASEIAKARIGLEEEKNRLVALMSELTEGVLVCNNEGRILLYNNRAKQLLGHISGSAWEDKIGGFVGLGRSVFGLIDRNAITHALDNLTRRREKQSMPLVSQFVATASNGQLIRTRMAPVFSPQQEINGFILTVEDITRQSQTSRRRDKLLQSLIEGIRSSLANIRAASETIEQFPQMEPQKLNQLRQIIQEESLTLSSRLNQTTAEYATDLKADWQLEEMLASDLLWAVQHWLEDNLEVDIFIEEQPENLWLRVDSYAIVQALGQLVRWLKADYDISGINLCLRRSGQLASIDLAWKNGIADMDTLWSWQNRSLSSDVHGNEITLSEVAERHGGEVWCQADKDTNIAYFRLLLPTTQPRSPVEIVTMTHASRPEFYDFDLFHQPGQTPELDERPLPELTYTVFDTETTGLNPSEGDEIISVGAVRIVNGRLLRHEIFDQLVDSRRSISPASGDIHGISAEMLQGQPTIEQVLPLVYRFAEGTVLVGHNAAFDMRLLQLKESKTGIKFTNPVLDTLLLSAVIHPNQKDHSLEAIAQRLGINVIGRHSSLGDAMLTGEIFLKLIPLLAERNILTLKDAREAARQTYYARLSY